MELIWILLELKLITQYAINIEKNAGLSTLPEGTHYSEGTYNHIVTGTENEKTGVNTLVSKLQSIDGRIKDLINKINNYLPLLDERIKIMNNQNLSLGLTGLAKKVVRDQIRNANTEDQIKMLSSIPHTVAEYVASPNMRAVPFNNNKGGKTHKRNKRNKRRTSKSRK